MFYLYFKGNTFAHLTFKEEKRKQKLVVRVITDRLTSSIKKIEKKRNGNSFAIKFDVMFAYFRYLYPAMP